jgi:hypothetical protein
VRSKRVFCSALLAFAAAASIASATSSAANPQFLKLGGGPPPFPIRTVAETHTGEGPKFETEFVAINCEKSRTRSGEITSLALGSTDVDMEGCHSNGGECTTTGDATGIILTGVTPVNVVAYKAGTLLLAGLLLSSLKFEVTCGLLVLKVEGAVIGLFGPLFTDATGFILLYDIAGIRQVPTSCEVPVAVCLPGGKTALYSLLVNFGAGFEHGLLVDKQTITTTTDLLVEA